MLKKFRPLLLVAAGMLGMLLVSSAPASAQASVISGRVLAVNNAGVTLDTAQGQMTLPWNSTQFVIGGYPVDPSVLAVGMTVQANVYGYGAYSTPYTNVYSGNQYPYNSSNYYNNGYYNSGYNNGYYNGQVPYNNGYNNGYYNNGYYNGQNPYNNGYYNNGYYNNGYNGDGYNGEHHHHRHHDNDGDGD